MGPSVRLSPADTGVKLGKVRSHSLNRSGTGHLISRSIPRAKAEIVDIGFKQTEVLLGRNDVVESFLPGCVEATIDREMTICTQTAKMNWLSL